MCFPQKKRGSEWNFILTNKEYGIIRKLINYLRYYRLSFDNFSIYTYFIERKCRIKISITSQMKFFVYLSTLRLSHAMELDFPSNSLRLTFISKKFD